MPPITAGAPVTAATSGDFACTPSSRPTAHPGRSRSRRPRPMSAMSLLAFRRRWSPFPTLDARRPRRSRWPAVCRHAPDQGCARIRHVPTRLAQSPPRCDPRPGNEAIDLLADRHLIRAEWRSGARWYELSHDRMIGALRADNRAYFRRSVRTTAADPAARANDVLAASDAALWAGELDRAMGLATPAEALFKQLDSGHRRSSRG